MLDALLNLGVRRAAVKTEEDGALLGQPDGVRLYVVAAWVAAVDGSGAGDAFIGRLLSALLAEEDLSRAGPSAP